MRRPMRGTASDETDRPSRSGSSGGQDIVDIGVGRRERSCGEHARRERGQALVEFALVAPIMVLIFAALVQLAFVYERQIGIENAVRDAARRAATYTTTTNAPADTNGAFAWNLLVGSGGLLEANVQAYSGDPAQLKNPIVCYRTQVDSAGNNAVMVKVSMGYAHPLFLPLISQILDGFDGTIDNALRIDTSSEFEVANSDPASVDRCFP